MLKNRDFFFLQYNKIDWRNQETTKINARINDYIIQNVLLKHADDSISLFDIGFGIGFFIRMFINVAKDKFHTIHIEGCEPSTVNYEYFADKKPSEVAELHPTGFLETQTKQTFDYITAIYVFPHFLTEDLESVARKINQMLKPGGKFILALANENYLKEKLARQSDLFIESGDTSWNSKKYHEVLHYSDIPSIGKIIDYNREEQFYLDLFSFTGFSLEKQEVIDDNGFLCSLFVFEKN